jgi:exodeoxyribonuclease V
MELSLEQNHALQNMIKWFEDPNVGQIFTLAGYAGTGKSTLINYLLSSMALDMINEVAIMAYAGKAVSVLRTRGISTAMTIHRFLYELVKDDYKNNKLIFRLRDYVPPNLKLLIVDEVSMVPGYILEDLMATGVKLLLVGDPRQLPPIEQFDPKTKKPRGISGIEYLNRPNAILTQIHRQAANNPILELSQHIRDGHHSFVPGQYCDPDGNPRLTIINSTDFWFDDTWMDYMTRVEQVLVGTNKSRENINGIIRKRLGLVSTFENFPIAGDKLIITRNNWSIPVCDSGGGILDYITNGMMVDVPHSMRYEAYKKSRHLFYMDINVSNYGVLMPNMCLASEAYEYNQNHKIHYPQDLRDTLIHSEYGWAITTHKAQGSQFETLMVFDESSVFGVSAQQWLYTAVTRARQSLVLVTPNIAN